jgi:hypothetical protein
MTQARLATAVTHAGIAVRYTFYAVGALVFAVIAIGMLMIWQNRIVISSDKAAFHIASPQLAQLPVTSKTITGGRYGRIELVQYGQWHDRNLDMAIALTMPPANNSVWREAAMDGIRPPRGRFLQTATYHDLETRFGAIRAREARFEADGQWKQCLTYISRFNTDAVHLIGWWCDASGAKPSPDRLACTLDRLVLDGSLYAGDADKFLRERMARSSTCSSAPVAQTMDTRTHTSTQRRRY